MILTSIVIPLTTKSVLKLAPDGFKTGLQLRDSIFGISYRSGSQRLLVIVSKILTFETGAELPQFSLTTVSHYL